MKGSGLSLAGFTEMQQVPKGSGTLSSSACSWHHHSMWMPLPLATRPLSPAPDTAHPEKCDGVLGSIFRGCRFLLLGWAAGPLGFAMVGLGLFHAHAPVYLCTAIWLAPQWPLVWHCTAPVISILRGLWPTWLHTEATLSLPRAGIPGLGKGQLVPTKCWPQASPTLPCLTASRPHTLWVSFPSFPHMSTVMPTAHCHRSVHTGLWKGPLVSLGSSPFHLRRDWATKCRAGPTLSPLKCAHSVCGFKGPRPLLPRSMASLSLCPSVLGRRLLLCTPSPSSPGSPATAPVCFPSDALLCPSKSVPAV